MENRIDRKFFDLKKKNKKALACFVTSCDPSLELSKKIINSLPNYGADIIEVGIPFSDPMADGPTIQRSSLRAIKSKSSISKTFNIIKSFRKKDKITPIILMGYFNPIFQFGLNKFFSQGKMVGVDGIIIDNDADDDSVCDDDEVMGCSDNTACNYNDLATNGYNDWYLPSKDELTILAQKTDITTTGFVPGDDGLWSSSSYNFYDVAWLCVMNNPPTPQFTSEYVNVGWVSVMPIRTFSSPLYSNEIMISSSGWNYVTVTDSLGCTANDSIYVDVKISGCTD